MKETAATALVDGNNSLGAVVGNYAMAVAIRLVINLNKNNLKTTKISRKAGECGVGWVTVRGSNHFGIAGHYSAQVEV